MFPNQSLEACSFFSRVQASFHSRLGATLCGEKPTIGNFPQRTHFSTTPMMPATFAFTYSLASKYRHFYSPSVSLRQRRSLLRRVSAPSIRRQTALLFLTASGV